jgi:hypothetical protein
MDLSENIKMDICEKALMDGFNPQAVSASELSLCNFARKIGVTHSAVGKALASGRIISYRTVICGQQKRIFIDSKKGEREWYERMNPARAQGQTLLNICGNKRGSTFWDRTRRCFRPISEKPFGKCVFCGKKISLAEYSHRKHCSRECQKKDTEIKSTHTCINCKKTFIRTPSGGNNNFCSNLCHHNYNHIRSVEIRYCNTCKLPYICKKNSKQRYCTHKCSSPERVKICRQKGLYIKADPNKVRERKNELNKVYRKENYVYGLKCRENTALFKHLGLSAVPIAVKKTMALRKIGLRICDPYLKKDHPITPDEIKNLISRIEKGETYAAYERASYSV